MQEPQHIGETEISEIVGKILHDKLGLEESNIRQNSRFIEDLGVDSLDMVELQMDLEKKFSISITDDEMEKVTTVSSLIKLIGEKK